MPLRFLINPNSRNGNFGPRITQLLISYYMLSREQGETQGRSKISRLIHFLEVQPLQKSHIQEAFISDFNLDYALEFVTASPDCSAYREVLLVQKKQALWIPMAIGRKVK